MNSFNLTSLHYRVDTMDMHNTAIALEWLTLLKGQRK